MQTVLLVVNTRAGSFSARKRDVIARALAADFKLEVAQTTGRDHATELSRDAVDRGFDAVVAFGGDGTINEVAQSLVGTHVALGMLPGGSTNVMARSLGLPVDPVEATSLVAQRLRSDTRRRVNVGRIGARYFLFSAGMGLDAEVVKRIEANPASKQRYGEWAFVSHALRAAIGRYRNVAHQIELSVENDAPERVALAICCNARPFTYFGRFPVDACPRARLDDALDVFGLRAIHLTTIPRVIWSVFVSRSHVAWRNSVYRHDIQTLSLRSSASLPVQVDGDYIGEWSAADVVSIPSALDLIV